jgi:hypothetical protein
MYMNLNHKASVPEFHGIYSNRSLVYISNLVKAYCSEGFHSSMRSGLELLLLLHRDFRIYHSRISRFLMNSITHVHAVTKTQIS